jgi:hypothetical protein
MSRVPTTYHAFPVALYIWGILFVLSSFRAGLILRFTNWEISLEIPFARDGGD